MIFITPTGNTALPTACPPNLIGLATSKTKHMTWRPIRQIQGFFEWREIFTGLTGWTSHEFLLLVEFGRATAPPPMSCAYAPFFWRDPLLHAFVQCVLESCLENKNAAYYLSYGLRPCTCCGANEEECIGALGGLYIVIFKKKVSASKFPWSSQPDHALASGTCNLFTLGKNCRSVLQLVRKKVVLPAGGRLGRREDGRYTFVSGSPAETIMHLFVKFGTYFGLLLWLCLYFFCFRTRTSKRLHL